MPLFVFVILGILQIQLLNQARLMTKYAAFKAARVGAIHSAKKSAMRNAALGVLLPFVGRRDSDTFYSARTPAKGGANSYPVNFVAAKLKNSFGSLVEVTVCEPSGTFTNDFDDPNGDMGAQPTSAEPSWEQVNRGRLAIQVTNWHQMVIPFANQLLWHIVVGKEDSETMRVMRMDSFRNRGVGSSFASGKSINGTVGWAALGAYVMPIRASWSMRMHSNFLTGSEFDLPGKGTNNCKISWARK